MYEFLSNEAWQGIGAIAGIIAILVSLWQAKRQPSNSKGSNTNWLATETWRTIAAIFSLLVPSYGIFVGSILFVNRLTLDPKTVIYGVAVVASVTGLTWGVVWANYIQRVFTSGNKRGVTHKSSIKEINHEK